MTAQYDEDGIQFLYPENWVLSEDHDWPRSVSLQSPGTAFWSLHVYSNERKPHELAGEVLRAMRDEYDGLDAELVQEEVEREASTDPSIGYDMDFHCLDLIVHSEVRAMALDGRTYVIQCQAEETEFEQMRQVFAAISLSLFRSVGQPG